MSAAFHALTVMAKPNLVPDDRNLRIVRFRKPFSVMPATRSLVQFAVFIQRLLNDFERNGFATQRVRVEIFTVEETQRRFRIATSRGEPAIMILGVFQKREADAFGTAMAPPIGIFVLPVHGGQRRQHGEQASYHA